MLTYVTSPTNNVFACLQCAAYSTDTVHSRSNLGLTHRLWEPQGPTAFMRLRCRSPPLGIPLQPKTWWGRSCPLWLQEETTCRAWEKLPEKDAPIHLDRVMNWSAQLSAASWSALCHVSLSHLTLRDVKCCDMAGDAAKYDTKSTLLYSNVEFSWLIQLHVDMQRYRAVWTVTLCFNAQLLLVKHGHIISNLTVVDAKCVNRQQDLALKLPFVCCHESWWTF